MVCLANIVLSFVWCAIRNLCFFPIDRMFTSRSEYRISIRSDNADVRLTEKAYGTGCISASRWEVFSHTKGQLEEGMRLLNEIVLTPGEWSRQGHAVKNDGVYRR